VSTDNDASHLRSAAAKLFDAPLARAQAASTHLSV
jgi:hypothetical protein